MMIGHGISARAAPNSAQTHLPHPTAQQSPEFQGAMTAPTVPVYSFGHWTLMLAHSLHHKECLRVLVTLIYSLE